MRHIEIQGLEKSYGDVPVLEGLSLEVDQGELLAVLGPSGCGKSTLLRCLAGLEAPSGGRIFMGGRDVTHLPPGDRNVGMVFQSYALFPNLDVLGNVTFGLRARGIGATEARRMGIQVLDMVELKGLEGRMIWEISGGQRQRVALARALAIRPQVLLLDEPLSALDAKVRERLREHIRGIQRELSVTTILVTHDQEEAMEMADRIGIMNRGRMLQVGTPEEVFMNPADRFVATFMGRANLIPAELAGRVWNLDGQSDWMIRPHLVDICSPHDPGAITGTVEDVVLSGGTVRVKVRIYQGLVVSSEAPYRPGGLPHRGQPVGIRASREHLVRLTGPVSA
jgi:putative spermidine/putrescine transport system ATP-binding protein